MGDRVYPFEAQEPGGQTVSFVCNVEGCQHPADASCEAYTAFSQRVIESVHAGKCPVHEDCTLLDAEVAEGTLEDPLCLRGRCSRNAWTWSMRRVPGSVTWNWGAQPPPAG